MKPVPGIALASVVLLTSGACILVAQRGLDPQPAAARIGPQTLQQRYHDIWASVGGVMPPLVVHLGAAAGNQIALWAKSEAERGTATRRWAVACTGTSAVEVREEVFDPRFGVSKLTITRNDGNTAPLPCTITLGGNSAQVVIPALPQSREQGGFSFLAYSCSEPFSTGHRGGIYARDLSLWLRMEARAAGERSRQLPERPDFVLGMGDQVYVDPDPNEPRPLALFRGTRSEEFLIHTDRDSLYGALDVVYRYNFSLPPVTGAFSRLPAFLMWDDHEIRDGWGSHRDERDASMQAYFGVARHAFVAHQLLRSYAPGTLDQAGYDRLVAGREALHRQFSHGPRTHVLMLDSRSTRGRAPSIFEEPDQRAVREWLGRGRSESGDLYVLGVGVPLFPSRTVKNLPDVVTRLPGGNLRDDLEDSWDSSTNRRARAELLRMLGAHFAANPRDRLLVLSGDVHYSALFFLLIDGRVVGQEVVTSGIAHALASHESAVNYLVDVAQGAGPFEVRPAGKITQSASFAELVVEPAAADGPPQLGVVFHINGEKRGNAWMIGNTNLLSAQDRPLWYHTYRYDYQGVSEHLDSVPAGVTPAGTVVPLPMEFPKLRTRASLLQRLLGRSSVPSAIEAQSIFCTIRDTDYNATLARSWDLNELATGCVPLEKTAGNPGPARDVRP